MLISKTQNILQIEIYKKLLIHNTQESARDDWGRNIRAKAGVLHHVRVAHWVVILTNFLRQIHFPGIEEIKQADVFCLQIAGLFNHAVWENDQLELPFESRKYCQSFLERIGIRDDIAYTFAALITDKALPTKNPKEKLLRMILQSADALDDMRYAHNSYSVKQIKIFNAIADSEENKAIFIDLLKNALEIIVDYHHDVQDSCYLQEEFCKTLFEKKGALMAKRDKEAIQRSYEHAADCYDRVSTEIRGNPLLKCYAENDPLELMNLVLQNECPFDARKQYLASLPQIEVKQDFFIKTLRQDRDNYFLTFIDGLLPPNPRDRLRVNPKKLFTVNGEGPVARAEKKSQYSLDEKNGFSKPQAITYCMPELQCLPFNFNRDVGIGVIGFDIDQNALLSHHLYTIDIGSVVRPYDFNTFEEAKAYYHKVHGKILHSKDELPVFKENFKRQYLERKYYSTLQFNEVLARLRWSVDGSMQLFIHVDTLESRLLAQISAAIVLRQLRTKKLCEEWYSVPICYYSPNSISHHLKPYTLDEQQVDRSYIESKINSPAFLQLKFVDCHFEALFFMNVNQCRSMLKTHVEANPLLLHILSQGYFYVIDYLIVLQRFEKHDLQALILSEIAVCDDALTLINMLYHAITKNRVEIIDAIILRLPQLPNSTEALNKPVDVDGIDFTVLQQAFFVRNDYAIQRITELPQIDFLQISKKQLTLLHICAASGDVDQAIFLLSKGVPLNQRDQDQASALVFAVRNNHVELVKYFLSLPDLDLGQSPELSLKDMLGFVKKINLLQFAVMNGSLEIVSLFYQDGRFDFTVKIPGDLRSLLHLAVGKSATLKFLLQIPGADIQHKTDWSYMGGITVFDAVVEAGDAEITDHLLNMGYQIDSHDWNHSTSHVELAASRGDVAVLEILLRHGLDPHGSEFSNTSPLESAVGSGHVESVRLLLRHMQDIGLRKNDWGGHVLHVAAEKGNGEIVDMLIAAGACVDYVDYLCRSLLGVAAAAGHANLVLHLLALGCKPQGFLAGIIQADEKHPDVITMLLPYLSDYAGTIMFYGEFCQLLWRHKCSMTDLGQRCYSQKEMAHEEEQRKLITDEMACDDLIAQLQDHRLRNVMQAYFSSYQDYVAQLDKRIQTFAAKSIPLFTERESLQQELLKWNPSKLNIYQIDRMLRYGTTLDKIAESFSAFYQPEQFANETLMLVAKKIKEAYWYCDIDDIDINEIDLVQLQQEWQLLRTKLQMQVCLTEMKNHLLFRLVPAQSKLTVQQANDSYPTGSYEC